MSKIEKIENNSKPLKIAICGIRGIPACYGGFETFAEELGHRLVNLGHKVIVYGRKHVISYQGSQYRGIDIRLLFAPRHKYLETPVHSILCFLDLVINNRVDVVLVCNAANSPFVWILKLFGIPVAINLDGIERLRAKWNVVGKLWYRLGEISSVLFSKYLIADAEVIREYYLKTYHASTQVIRYGCVKPIEERIFTKSQFIEFNQLKTEEGDLFKELGIEPGRYILYLSRLEPENNALLVILAYNQLPQEIKSTTPLLIVGDAPYAKDYIDQLKIAAKDQNIIFAGYRFGSAYKTLQYGAKLYIQATEVGGTHPALVEAMGFANCIIANSTAENLEVLGNAGMFYKKNNIEDLSNLMSSVLNDSKLQMNFRKAALERAQQLYDWDKITNDYKELFIKMVSRV